MTLAAPARARVALGGVMIVGTLLRVWGIQFGLPHTVARPDEEFIIGKALGFFSGDFNPHFFEWPSLYLYFTHALLRLTFVSGHALGSFNDPAAFVAWVVADPAWVHLLLRFISAGCGVVTLAVLYRLGLDLFGRRVAITAAFLLAVAFLPVRDAHLGVLDVPLSLLIVLCVLILARAVRREIPIGLFVLAGLIAGCATSIKYNGGGLLLVAMVAAVLHSTDPAHRRRSAVVAFSLFVLAWAVCAVAGTPYALLDYPSFQGGLAAQLTRLTDGHGIRIDNGWHHHLMFSLRHGLGAPLLVAALIGLPLSLRAQWRSAALLWTFPLAYYAVIGAGHTAFVRYALPIVPFLCIAAAVAVCETASLASRRRPRLTGPLVVLMTLILAAPSLYKDVLFNRLLAQPDTRLLAADWLARHMPPGAGLFESGWIYAQPHLAWPPTRGGYVTLAFDTAQEQFIVPSGALREADFVVVARSPLRVYTPVPAELERRLASSYTRVAEFSAVKEGEYENASWFDRHDAFFLPYVNLEKRQRPGPELSVYQRKR